MPKWTGGLLKWGFPYSCHSLPCQFTPAIIYACNLTPAKVYPFSFTLANVHPSSFTPAIVKTGRVNYGRSETGRVWAVAGRQVGRALTGGWRPSSPPAAAAFQICCQLSIFELTRGQVSAVNIWRPIVDFWYLTNSVSCVEVCELHVLSWVGFSCSYGCGCALQVKCVFSECSVSDLWVISEWFLSDPWKFFLSYLWMISEWSLSILNINQLSENLKRCLCASSL